MLAGGELAAMVVCDAVLRKLPGALGHADSAEEESFSAALGGDPEYPHYTRPAEYRGWNVPEVLLSGHHEEIRQWRRARSRERGAASGSDERAADACTGPSAACTAGQGDPGHSAILIARADGRSPVPEAPARRTGPTPAPLPSP